VELTKMSFLQKKQTLSSSGWGGEDLQFTADHCKEPVIHITGIDIRVNTVWEAIIYK
jgi:hypothetical protein